MAEDEATTASEADRRFAGDLRGLLTLAATADTIAAPLAERQLLELVVATAMRVIGARAAALLLVDEERRHLTFEVAVGGEPQAVRGLRIPLGHGIAGLVAASGQPIAIGDAGADPRQAADIASLVGYHPQSVLCVPLLDDDRVVGVLELLDKVGTPGFAAADMEVLGLFAQQAGVTIAQLRVRRNLARLLGDLARGSVGEEASAPADLEYRAAQFVARLTTDDASYRRAIALATIAWEIARVGEAEAEACATLLRGFADYLRGRR